MRMVSGAVTACRPRRYVPVVLHVQLGECHVTEGEPDDGAVDGDTSSAGSGPVAVECESDDGAAQVGQGMYSRELTSSVTSGRAVEVSPAGQQKTKGGTYQSDDRKVERPISGADVHDEGESRRDDHTGLRGRRDDAAAALHDGRVGVQQRCRSHFALPPWVAKNSTWPPPATLPYPYPSPTGNSPARVGLSLPVPDPCYALNGRSADRNLAASRTSEETRYVRAS